MYAPFGIKYTALVKAIAYMYAIYIVLTTYTCTPN